MPTSAAPGAGPARDVSLTPAPRIRLKAVSHHPGSGMKPGWWLDRQFLAPRSRADTRTECILAVVGDPPRCTRCATTTPRFLTTPQIKRVLGLPNERIAFRGRAVNVHDALLEESCFDDPITPCGGDLSCSGLIPYGHVCVLADHRTTSLGDSRSCGPIAVGRIVGMVEGVVWSPSHLGPLTRVEYAADC